MSCRYDGFGCAALLAMVALSSAWASGVVHAQDLGTTETSDTRHQQGRQRAEQGEALFDAGNYDSALTEFETAYGLLSDLPEAYVLLFNVAQCHERMFRYDAALATYHRYLEAGGPDAQDAATVRATITALESLVGTLRVQTNTAADLWLDDRLIGQTGTDISVPGGPHALEVRATGYASERRQIQVTTRSRLDIDVTLHETNEFHGFDQGYFWASLVATVVVGAVGAGFGARALTVRGTADGQLQRADSLIYMDALTSERSEIQTDTLIADVMFGVCGAFALTTLILAFVTDWGGSNEPTVTVAIGPSEAGIAVRGTF